MDRSTKSSIAILGLEPPFRLQNSVCIGMGADVPLSYSTGCAVIAQVVVALSTLHWWYTSVAPSETGSTTSLVSLQS